MTTTDPPLSDEDRLLFGAGFVFGVACVLSILAIVVATVGGPSISIGTPVFVPIAASIVVTAIIGITLYLLAFPENRTAIPVHGVRSLGADDDESA